MKKGDVFVVGNTYARRFSYTDLVGRIVACQSVAPTEEGIAQHWVHEIGDEAIWRGEWHVADEDLLPINSNAGVVSLLKQD